MNLWENYEGLNLYFVRNENVFLLEMSSPHKTL